jgi:segregation and condensation protein A
VAVSDETRNDDLIATPLSVSSAERYELKLPTFEGPLDLLLHLIKQHEVDILNIPVAFITEKYLEYLDLLRVLNLDVAGEYLLMAATLVHLKSKMLLPKPVEADEEEDEIDPRADLVRRLLEYQKYKDAAQQLAGRQLLYRDVFPRSVDVEEVPQELAPLAEVSVFALLEAFAEVLKRVGSDLTHEVQVDRLSVSERIGQLADRLRAVDRLEFRALFDDAPDRHLMVITFLALLEMARLRLLRLFQEDDRTSIWVKATGVAEGGAIDVSGDASFEYREPLAPTPVAAPRELTEEELALVTTLGGEPVDDEDDEPLPEF